MTEEGILFRIGANIDGLRTAFDNIETMARQQLAGAMREVGGILSDNVTRPLLEVGGAALKMGSDMQQAQIAFTTMLGSASAATKFLGDLRGFAATTPFEFPGLVDAARRLQALGFAADQVIPSLNAIGNASAALGGGAAMIDRVTLALGQMQSKGKVSTQEINQLAEAGIGAWKILADSMGKKVPEVMALAEKGMISASRAVPELLAALNEKYGGMMEQQAKTVAGHWSNIKDQMTAVMTDLGQALAPAAGMAMDALEPLLGLAKLAVDAFKELSPQMQLVVVGVVGLAAAAGPALVAMGALGASIAGISAGMAVITGPAMLGALVIGLKALAVGAAAVAVAWGAWKLGEWLMSLTPVKAALDAIREKLTQFFDWFSKLPGVASALKMVGDAWSSMSGAVMGVVDKAKAAGKSMVDAAKSGLPDLKKSTDDWYNHGNQVESAAKKAAAAAAKMAAEIESGWAKIATTLHNLPKSFSEFEAALAKGFNATGSLKQLDEQIWKLEQGFGSKIPEAIRKGMIVHLDIAKKALVDFKTQADQIKLDDAFSKATASVLAFTTNLKNAGKEGLGYLNSLGLGTKAITDQATAAAGAWLQLDKDLKTLSVTTGTNLAKAAKDATSAYNGLVLAAEAGLISSVDLQKGLVQALQAQVAAAKAAGEPWQALDNQLKTAQKTLTSMTGTVKESGSEMEKAWKGFGNQVSTIFTDLGKGVANSILHAKGLGDAFTQAANAIKEAFTRMVVEGAINSVMKSLKGLEVDFTNFGASIAKMFKGVFEGISSALGGIGKALGGLFGTGTETVTKTVGGVTGAGGGAGGGALGGVTGAVGGITGVVGAIGSIGTMISSIVGNFQMAGMNKTLDLLEKGIRYSEAHLLHILENSNKYWPLLNNTIELLRLEAIERYTAEGNEYLRAMASGGNLGDAFGAAVGQLATALQNSQAQITVNLTQATRTMGEGMRGSMQQLITDSRTIGQTSVNWLKLISEGVWATYSAVAKAGAPQTTAPGERATYVPGRTTTPVNGPGNTINVNLQTQSTNPYQQAVLIAQNLNNLLPSRA